VVPHVSRDLKVTWLIASRVRSAVYRRRVGRDDQEL